MSDYIIRGVSDDGAIRVFCMDATNIVKEAKRLHSTYPTATVALGRALIATSIMGHMLKGEKDTVSLVIKGNGPLGGITAVSDSQGNVRGYVNRPDTDLPLRESGKFDVGRAIGEGMMNIIRDYNLKEPYIGHMPLVSGEIGDDITYYYAKSEQIPTSVALGVSLDENMEVKAAGGFIIQLMPEATMNMVSLIETKLIKLQSVSNMLAEGKKPEDIIGFVLDDFKMSLSKPVGVEYKCNCSHEKIENVIRSLGVNDIKKLIEEQNQAEVSCHFCQKKYVFTKDELDEIINDLEGKKWKK